MMGDKKADFLGVLEKIGALLQDLVAGEFHLLQKFADKSRDSVRQAVCQAMTSGLSIFFPTPVEQVNLLKNALAVPSASTTNGWHNDS